MRILGREPALILQGVGALLSLAISLGLPLSTEQAGLTVAVVSAVFGAIAAALTRPIAPQAFVAVVAAVTALTASFGFDVAPETIGALNALIVVGFALVARPQVTPTTAAPAA